jgi:hypothetical protein
VNKGPIQGSICFKLILGLLVLKPLSKVAFNITFVIIINVDQLLKFVLVVYLVVNNLIIDSPNIEFSKN